MKKFFFCLVFILTAWGTAGASGDTVLARVGDTKITLADFNRIVGYYDAEKQKLLEQQPQYKATILQRIVQTMVVSKIAEEKGFDKREDVKEQVGLLSKDFLTMEYLKKEVVGNIQVAEDDMKIYYKSHPESFTTPEMVRARYIFLKSDSSASEGEKKKVEEKAGELLKKIKAGEDFAKLAAEASDDPGSKNNGGDLGFFPKGKTVPEFEKVAFSLKPGEVSDVFETEYGFHILKVEEKKDAVPEPYDKVKDRIREKVFADLKANRVKEFVEKAMKDAGVELNLEHFMPKK